jgi:hypothetical protein
VNHSHRLLLADTVTPRNGLLLVLGVGVGVVHDDSVSRLQVETATSGSDREEEDEDRRVWRVEVLNRGLPLVEGAATVDATVLEFLACTSCVVSQLVCGAWTHSHADYRSVGRPQYISLLQIHEWTLIPLERTLHA